MTTARSVFSEKSLAYYRYKLRRNRKITVILIILNAIGFPLVYLASIINGLYKKSLPIGVDYSIMSRYEGITGVFVIVAFLAIACALTAGVFVVFAVFDYLYNKTLVDMAYSAPLTAKQRFWMDFSAGLTMYVGPFLAGSLVGLLMSGLGGLLGIPFNMMPEFSSLLGLVFSAVLAMLMLFAMTTLVAVCCGSLFESIVYTGVLNGIIPAVIYAGYYTALEGLYGISNSGELANTLFFRLSPIGVVVAYFDSYIFTGSTSGVFEPHLFFQTLLNFFLPVLLVIAGYIFLSYRLYKRRKAENTGNPFVFKLLYYVLITSITLVITALFLADREYDLLLPAVILTGVLYLIMEVITNRGFKAVWKSLLRFAGTFACCVLVIAVVKETEAFGMPYRVPQAANVRNVTLLSYRSLADGESYDLTLTDREDIEQVIAVQQEMLGMYRDGIWPWDYYTEEAGEIETYEQDWRNVEDTFYVTLRYKMMNGWLMEREYRIPERVYRQWSNFLLTDAGKKMRSEELDAFTRGVADARLRSIYDTNEVALSKLLDPVDGQIRAELYNGFQVRDFVDAVKQDIQSETAEQYYTPTEQPLAAVSLSSANNSLVRASYDQAAYSYRYNTSVRILIKPHYTNTIAYLEKIGLSGYLKNNLDDLLTSGNYTYFLKQPETTYTQEERSTADSPSFENYFGPKLKRLGDSEQIRRLIRVAQPQYYAQENCYLLMSNNGLSLLIPPEYAALAQEVFESTEATETQSYQLDEKDAEYAKEYAEKNGYTYVN